MMADLIDRQAAMDALEKRTGIKWELLKILQPMLCVLEVLPSAQPERKRGEWIRTSPTEWMWTCSCCKKDDAYAYSAGESCEPDVLQDMFCPNCGADMRGNEDG